MFIVAAGLGSSCILKFLSLTYTQVHSKATPLSQPRHSSVDQDILCMSVVTQITQECSNCARPQDAHHQGPSHEVSREEKSEHLWSCALESGNVMVG